MVVGRFGVLLATDLVLGLLHGGGGFCFMVVEVLWAARFSQILCVTELVTVEMVR
jgi:hypothetical protein